MPDLLLGGIAISEFLADPNGVNNFDTDGNGSAVGRDEFIEFINVSGSAIDISGLELWDAGRDNWFTFPSGTVLEPGATALVVRDIQAGGSLPSVSGDNLAFDANFVGNVFNNAGDNIVVYDPANDEFIQATYNGDTLDDPTTSANAYDGFSTTATRVGTGEDFGTDQDGFSIQRGSNGFTNDSTPTPGSSNVCFASGTLLDTPAGYKAIEQLRVGDLVATRDSGYQPIRWIFARKVTQADLIADPSLAPVFIDPAVLGLSKVKRPLGVSRQHRLLVTGKIAKRIYGENEVLVPAKDLLRCDGVSVQDPDSAFYYFHVLLDEHHILSANGVAAESLYLGPETVRSISDDAYEELGILFPDTLGDACFNRFRPARELKSGRRARNMVKRYSRNSRMPLAPF